MAAAVASGTFLRRGTERYTSAIRPEICIVDVKSEGGCCARVERNCLKLRGENGGNRCEIPILLRPTTGPIATALADSRAFPLSSPTARIAPHYVFGLDAASPPLHLFPSSFLPESAVNTFLPHFHSIHSLFRPTNGLDWLPYPPSLSQRRFALALALSYQLPTGFPQPSAFSSRVESRPDMGPSWDGSEQG